MTDGVTSRPISFTNPFVRPIKWKTGPKGGFIVFPHSDDVPEGWGDPTKEEDGSPIVPGTEGGPNPNKYVAYGKEWKSFRSPAWQVAGPIDWKGPLSNPSNERSKRKILSYWGPTSRHFNFAKFEYGSDIRHKEIYFNGKLLAIAPFPVLGAALHQYVYEIEEDGVTKEVVENWVVAILKNGGDDECWIRPQPKAILYETLTDELREAMEAEENSLNPDGWRLIGTFAQQVDAYVPETPWFFNATGDTARCMRRVSKTFDDGSGSNVTEYVFIEYKVRVTISEDYKTALFESLPLDPTHGFRYEERTEKYQQEWDYLGDPDERWQEDIIETKITCDGLIQVAVDYDGDELLRGYVKQDATRAFYFYWMLGIGANNSGRTDGEQVARGVPGLLINPLPGDHQTEQWLTAVDDVVLNVLNVETGVEVLNHKLQYVAAMSQTMFSTGIDSNADTKLYFWEGLFTYLHFLDMREPMLVARTDSVSNTYGPPGNWHKASLSYAEWAQMDASDHPYRGTDAQGFFSHHTVPYEDNLVFYTWVRATMLSWPVTISQTINRFTYHGGYLDPNAGAALYQPYLWSNMQAWYVNLAMAPYLRIWPLKHVLEDDKAYRPNAVFGMDERGNALVYFEYRDAETDEEAVAQALYPGWQDISEVVTYGEKFDPGGVV